MVPDGLSCLVTACSDSQGEPGMVVQDRQGVAPSTFGDGNMALEVHLPQLVGLGVLESLIGLVLGALGRIDKSVAPQYRRDSALGGHTIVSSVFEHLCQHVRSLSRMLSSKDLFRVFPGLVRRSMWSPRKANPLSPCSRGPLKSCGFAPTQLAHVGPFRQGHSNQFLASRHDRSHLPWHVSSPKKISCR